MDAITFHNRIPVKWWTGITVLAVLLILLVGLNPGGIFPPNRIEWLQERTGLRFEKNGIAYTDSISDFIRTDISQNTFSIEIALKSKSFAEDGFHFILLVHGGQDNRQLLVGQWKSSLIVMNGDDYSYSRRTERLTLTSDAEFPEAQFITITTGDMGTCLYLNGRLEIFKKDMRLKLPDGGRTRLVFGNSVYGNHPWEGDFYGAAIYGEALSENDVMSHYDDWRGNKDFTFARTEPSVILYNLDNGESNIFSQNTDSSHALRTPPRIKPLTPSFFFQTWHFWKTGRSLHGDLDALLNFFGFIPLGLLLGATLIRMGGKPATHCIALSVATGFLVSFLIETLQAWMPLRSSDIQDLVLNTAGTFAGTLCCRYLLLKSN